MSNRPFLPPAAPPPLPTRLWRAMAAIAGETAVVLLTLHHNAQFVAAGLLATGTAITALAETGFRARWGRPSDLADVLAAALALATVLMCLLALAASHRPG
jgi:ABC-type phosphate transport system permease subunit